MNPFLEPERSRGSKRLRYGEALLIWLTTQPGAQTTAANATLANHLNIPLEEGRPQSRRLNEALEVLAEAGLVEVVYGKPHPRLNPAGRTITLSPAGRARLGYEPAPAAAGPDATPPADGVAA
jgi:DNA-binding IscR family transcriptional regulator